MKKSLYNIIAFLRCYTKKRRIPFDIARSAIIGNYYGKIRLLQGLTKIIGIIVVSPYRSNGGLLYK
jgi:hypothetical protein